MESTDDFAAGEISRTAMPLCCMPLNLLTVFGPCVGVEVLRAATSIRHLIVEALLIILYKKSEGQPRTYRHRKLTFICPTGPCSAESSAASIQLKCTSRRIVTETRPIRNRGILSQYMAPQGLEVSFRG
jgi:hypothetical protein